MLLPFVHFPYCLLFRFVTLPHLIPSATNGHLTSSGVSNSAVKVLEHVFWYTYACISGQYTYQRVKFQIHGLYMYCVLVDYTYIFFKCFNTLVCYLLSTFLVI